MAGHFANARVEKLIRNAGAKRVSAEAIESMNEIVTDYGTLERVYISSRNVDVIPDIPHVDVFFTFVLTLDIHYISASIGDYSFRLSYDNYRRYHTLSIQRLEPILTFEGGFP